MSADKRVVIVHKKTRVYDGVFKLDEAEVTHSRLSDDGFVRHAKLLVFERGDSAAALVHDVERDVVVLAEQFRFPTYGKTTGWTVEPIAGSIEPDETPEECIRREMLEELGYRAGSLQPIAVFFTSPGGTSERIFLFYAPVRPTDLVDPGASGLAAQNENIARVEMPFADFVERATRGGFDDAKMLIAGLWLAGNKPK